MDDVDLYFFKENIFGIFVITLVVVLSLFISKILSNFNLLISSAFLCIFIGLILGNLFSFKDKIEPFIEFSLKKLLRIGIALLGLSLSFNELLNYGSMAILLVVMNIIIAFLIVIFLCRLFKIPNKLGYLITMGTCICGVTAVIATSSIIKTDKSETSYAVSIVTLFGIIAVFSYPYLANYFFHTSSDLAGIFLGTAIHDTAQVSAAGVIYSELFNSEEALNSAMTTKLLRNSFLVILIPLIAYLYNKDENVNIKKSIKDFFPFFVLAFIILAIVRTLGDFVFVDDNLLIYWTEVLATSKKLSVYLILCAMVALGLQTDLKGMMSLGIKPLVIGFSAAVIVGLVSVIYLLMLL